jgi:hypothetical protein
MAEEMGDDEKKKKAKVWEITGKNLIERRTTKMLIEDALLTRFEDEKTRQVYLLTLLSHLIVSYYLSLAREYGPSWRWEICHHDVTTTSNGRKL